MVTDNHYRWDFIQLSTDTKPTPETSNKVVNGSTLYTSDNSKLYIWYKDRWYEKTVTGGGGGGSYTAGNGIDITDDTISVDTTTIQEKLTAGTGIDITNNTISATGGSGSSVIELTSDLYNYPAGNPTGIALWLLDSGFYEYKDSNVNVFLNSTGISPATDSLLFIESGTNASKYLLYSGLKVISYLVNKSNGNFQAGYPLEFAVNPLTGNDAPTTSTKANYVGQLYLDVTHNKTYICTNIASPNFTWTEIGGGGGGVTPVQTTGTSTTDVMSQNATTSMVFADAGTNQKVQIGSNASATGGSSVSIGRDSKAEAVSATAVGRNTDAKSQASTAIGYYSTTNGEGSLAIGDNALGGSASNARRAVAIGSNSSAGHQGSIAVGAYSYVTSVGEMNIGAYNQPDYGYNYSTYRLLSGVYDGQNAHDAVTVGQVNSVIDAINTALSTNIPHIGA